MTGDVVEEALAARAVEPHAGAAGHGDAEALCLNCGTRLIGEHCHRCGQSAHVHRTASAVGHELAHGVFHFEGKIWRTLPMLVLRPGELTRRYVTGERARFVSPLALFLFTVFLMFTVYSAVGPSDLALNLGEKAGQADAGLRYGREETVRAVTMLRAERAAAIRSGKPVAQTDRRIADAERELQRIAAVRARLVSRDTVTVKSDWPWLDQAIARARNNPALAAYKVQSSAYKFSWMLILLSTPFVALLFVWRRRFNLYDHAIFVTYSIAFMSLLVIAIELALALGADGALLWTAALLTPPVHMFAQLRGAYALPVWPALWRTVFLLAFSAAILLLFVLGLIALGVSS